MPKNALLDESKDLLWPLALQGYADKIRMQKTVVDVLEQARPATLGKGDMLIHGALKSVLIEGIVAGDWRWVHATLATILGLDPTIVPAAAEPGLVATSVPAGNERSVEGLRKPAARATGR